MAGPSSPFCACFADADRGTQVCGLDEHRIFQFRDHSLDFFWIFLPFAAQNRDVPDDRKSRGDEQGLHDVFVHTGGGTEDTRTNVGNISQFEQALDGAVFAESAVKHGENDVDIDGAVGSSAHRGCICLKRDESAFAVHRLRRDHDRFTAGKDGSGLRDFRIAGAQVARLKHELAGEQIFGVLGSEPASIFCDADGHDFVFLFIDCVEN